MILRCLAPFSGPSNPPSCTQIVHTIAARNAPHYFSANVSQPQSITFADVPKPKQFRSLSGRMRVPSGFCYFSVDGGESCSRRNRSTTELPDRRGINTESSIASVPSRWYPVSTEGQSSIRGLREGVRVGHSSSSPSSRSSSSTGRRNWAKAHWATWRPCLRAQSY